MALEESVTYPMERDDWVTTVLVGGVLILLGFLVVPVFAAYGYVVQTIRGSLSGAPEPPAFDDWGRLLVDGVQAWLITVVYLFVPAVVGAVAVGGSAVAILTGGDVGTAVGVGGLLLGFALSALLSLVFGYFAVVGVVNFAREDRFAAGFDFGVIRAVALHREYAVAWLLSPFASFYAAVVAADLWADGFAGAHTATAGTARPAEDDTTV
jgi:hypothetical protein